MEKKFGSLNGLENNIGVVDTSVPLPLEIQLESETISLSSGTSEDLNFVVSPKPYNEVLGGSLILSTSHDFLSLDLLDSPESFQLVPGTPQPIRTNISASDDAIPGTYQVLIGIQSSDIAVSKYVTVTVE